jgi:hypothetical protein
MIAVESLMDIDALPWQADWYRTKVRDALGPRIDDNFRLWFIDHAQHTPPVGAAAQARTISYQGVLEQALRDVSAWVERGVPPPSNTRYTVDQSQVQVPPRAGDRGGIQPVVSLTANGRERADVGVGQLVTFVAEITVPPDTGRVVAAEWDLLGAGDYPVPGQFAASGSSVSVKTTYSYSKPGTYFPVLRATSHREGDPKTPYARVQNLARVRVVVK